MITSVQRSFQTRFSQNIISAAEMQDVQGKSQSKKTFALMHFFLHRDEILDITFCRVMPV